LTGKHKGLCSFSVYYECRVIFRFIVRLKFQKRSELKFASRTIPQSRGHNTPQFALGFHTRD
jgi:hypothetical protein